MVLTSEYDLQGRPVRFRGRRCRVHRYVGDGRFEVRYTDDLIYRTHRDKLVFLPLS